MADSIKSRTKLITWFQQNRRDLPWREGYSPYQVWISEIMLQQTRVQTMLPYFRRWLERFPDPAAVAAASEDELLKAWEGLGYYSRVRNIQKTAQILLERYRGRLPADHRTLLSFPGIGPYTAGAIMSLAFNQNYPAVDGNVKRVLARLFNLDGAVNAPATKRRIERLAGSMMPAGQARIFNQALMELGALICLPRNPDCRHCPVAESCRALDAGVVDQRPVRERPKRARPLEVVVGVLARDGEILIQKRSSEGLMPGLWEFPGGKIEPGETPEQALGREFQEELQLDVAVGERLAVIRHAYTSFRVTLHAYRCFLVNGRQHPVLGSAVAWRWTPTRQLRQYPFPAANKRLIELLAAKEDGC